MPTPRLPIPLSLRPRPLRTAYARRALHLLCTRRRAVRRRGGFCSPSPSPPPFPLPLTCVAVPLARRTLCVTSHRLSGPPLRDPPAAVLPPPPRKRRENIYTLPNLLSLARLIAAPATVWLILAPPPAAPAAAALALFAAAGATDALDGWLARRWRQTTVAGSVLDPLADKSLVLGVTGALAATGALPPPLAALILGRDASLGLAALYYRGASLPPPRSWRRYWDFSLPSALVRPTPVSKVNTLLQLLLLGGTLAVPVLGGGKGGGGEGAAQPTAATTALTGLQVVVAGTTAWSGLSYAWYADAVTILGADEGRKARQGARGRALVGLGFGGCVVGAAYLAVRGAGAGGTR